MSVLRDVPLPLTLEEVTKATVQSLRGIQSSLLSAAREAIVLGHVSAEPAGVQVEYETERVASHQSVMGEGLVERRFRSNKARRMPNKSIRRKI